MIESILILESRKHWYQEKMKLWSEYHVLIKEAIKYEIYFCNIFFKYVLIFCKF